MLKYILFFILALTTTFVNAADRDPGVTVRVSAAKISLHKMEGLADTVSDQRDLETIGDASRPEGDVWDKEDTTRYAVEIMKGAKYGDNVIARIGGIIIPAYEVDAVAKDGSMSMELRTDGIGLKAEIEYIMGNFSVGVGIGYYHFETDISSWIQTPDGEIENHSSIGDDSVSPDLSVAYRFNETLSLRYDYTFDVGTKGFHGSGPMQFLQLQADLY